MSRVPARCIVLLEDLDAAFTRSVTRDQGSNGVPDSRGGGGGDGGEDNPIGPQPAPPSLSRHRRHREQMSDVNTLSLSGLLNALDGVAASEGRILFA